MTASKTMRKLNSSIRVDLGKQKRQTIQQNQAKIKRESFLQKYSRKRDDLKVAIKSIMKRNIQSYERRLIESELRNMYRIEHINVIRLISHFEDSDTIYLVTELCAHGNLYQFLSNQGGKFNEKLCAFFLRQILSAIEYLHNLTPPIIHRDIKPENILISDNLVIKLIDFGSSKAFEQSKVMQTQTGTPVYMPPEIIQVNQQSEKVDMWTLGVLIYEFLSGETPFDDKQDAENPMRLQLIQQNILKKDIRFPNDFPPLAKGLILQLLNRNPEQRPNIQQIRRDPWLNQFKEEEDDQTLRNSLIPINDKHNRKLSDYANSIFQLKIREKSSINFEKDKRDKKEELREEISKVTKEIFQLKTKQILQQQQIAFLINYLESNKEKISSKNVILQYYFFSWYLSTQINIQQGITYI